VYIQLQLALDGASISDAEVVNWADEIRRERNETAPWHYVNIPLDAASFDPIRDGRGDGNVIDAIGAQTKIPADKSQPCEKRQEALKFVIHFVGDLHQPLHSADRGDKGGNTRLVMYDGQSQAQNLHTVWDRWLVRDCIWSAHFSEHGKGTDLPGVTGTLWAAYNGVAELIDHRQVQGAGRRVAPTLFGEGSKQADDRRLESAWFGDGYSAKVRAYREGCKLLATR
jgi:hypothetical protein